ncbi:MAG: SRPBCC family protein [Gemmatimonadetes bacterium]|nr:SRPBCC family protein [Gemmatimonadota bacterium]MBP7549041.1 SRPBCC family protein [Gemmatimonadaceae bacterium]
MARIEFSLFIAAPVGRCFDLSRSVELHVASTAGTGERVVAGRTSGCLELGESVTWRARHFGVWQELTSRIVAMERPDHFRDSQVRGAFARFDHDHHFTHDRDGTIMREVFDYRAPLGPLGVLAERLFLTRYMRRFLLARARVVKAVAESEEWRRYVGPAGVALATGLVDIFTA